MKLAIFIFLLVLLIILTVTFKRTLHLFEVMFIWMTVWLVTHSISSILIENLELISISQEFDDFWLHVLKRLILYPLITVQLIDLFIKSTSKVIHALIFIMNIIILTLFEFFFIHIGILISHNYSLWVSIIEWTVTITITYLTWYWYRKKYLLR
jgi:hypothetical protein